MSMKRLIIALMAIMPLASMAQNTWEMPEKTEDGTVINPDQKYLVGAVPVVDGRVVFTKELEARGKSAQQIFDIVKAYMQKMTKEPNQFEQSRITFEDTASHTICGSYQEWLVFKDKALVLDRTRFMYNLLAKCEDGKATLTITRIYYLYDEERQPQNYRAEEWITDEYGLKKNKQKLSRVTGKFRRKTIDRKDYIFNKIETLLNKQP